VSNFNIGKNFMFGIRLLIERKNRKLGIDRNDELHNLYSSRKGDKFSRSHVTTDGRSVSHYVKVSSTTLGLVTKYYFISKGCFLKVAVLSLWGALSDKRTGLQFAV
jgi:hypothetical protein